MTDALARTAHRPGLGPGQRAVVALLRDAERPLSVSEISQRAGVPMTTAWRACRSFAANVAHPSSATAALWMPGREPPALGLSTCACGATWWRAASERAWFSQETCEACR